MDLSSLSIISTPTIDISSTISTSIATSLEGIDVSVTSFSNPSSFTRLNRDYTSSLWKSETSLDEKGTNSFMENILVIAGLAGGGLAMVITFVYCFWSSRQKRRKRRKPNAASYPNSFPILNPILGGFGQGQYQSNNSLIPIQSFSLVPQTPLNNMHPQLPVPMVDESNVETMRVSERQTSTMSRTMAAPKDGTLLMIK